MSRERYQNTILLDWGLFIGGVAATWFMGWSTKDLLWGVWISSLVSGVVFFSRGLLATKSFRTRIEGVISSVTLIFGLGLFILHFGAFHYLQASILDLFIPIEPDPGRVYIGHLTWKHVRAFSIFTAINVGLRQYWPLVLATVVHQFFSAPPNLNSQNENFTPYLFVLKMHFMMFVLGGLYTFGLESFPVYVLVLLFFFAPSLKLLFWKKSTGGPAGG
jgi:hypothetical protein